ncbi:hypothetical protein DUNSADRAFT_17230 [Dunaliella salina]|uniref:AN1-type domain-containing protein n=1 Tax=Dunaliella salina TaxID=3046 RepID=A0ABQ7G240_DUNSA|nr:hypothetical protein DUNSADRAFT_17230 [Dunaliella salina]|eukprot:KAF5828670.1 hypothetical protein DUNSADRAFT_17230 [Dunaliella salina]
MADLMGFGKHCKICNQVDYLPFQCSSCNGVFCAEHRTQAQHGCPAAAGPQGGVVVCPLCAKAIHVKPQQSADAAFDLHNNSTECDPSNYQRVHEKPRCPVEQGGLRCKEKLTEINTYRCKHCGTRVCLKHRMPDDHQCQQRQAAARNAAADYAKRNSMIGKLQNMVQPRPLVPTASGPKAMPGSSNATPRAANTRRPQQPVDPSNTVKGTAARRMQAPEMCPQCSERFATVEQLIVHVDAQHMKQPEQRPGQAGTLVTGLNGRGVRVDEVFRCPHGCRYTANDAAQLVAHVERCHLSPSRQNQQKDAGSCAIS